MRPWALVLSAALLTGCTAGFPAGAPILGDLEVGDLGAGDAASRTFQVAAGTDFLAVGYRLGPAEHLHLTLTAPNSTRFDLEAGTPRGPCVVHAVPGAWNLTVAADAFDGALRGGKLTLRAGHGAPPDVYTCADDVFPGRAANVSLAVWRGNLTAGEDVQLSFDEPFALRNLTAAVHNATNLTVLLAPAGEAPLPLANLTGTPLTGAWRAVLRPLDNATNVTVGVFGIGV